MVACLVRRWHEEMTRQGPLVRSRQLTTGIVLVIGCLLGSARASAQGDLTAAPYRLTLPVTVDPPGEGCRRLEKSGAPLSSVSLHRTFQDDFDEHPLLSGKWTPHYAVAPTGRKPAIGEEKALTSNGKP